MTTTSTGLAGEETAAGYLKKKGFTIVARNYRARGGELDIVAQKGKLLVFAEVKTRAYHAFGGPLMAVTKAKQHKIALAAAQFIKANAFKFDSIRFDVICVMAGVEILHFPNAFSPDRTTL